MRIAIVGSEGYLGTALVPALKGHELLRIDAGLWSDPPAGVVHCHRALEILGRLRGWKPDVVVWLAALAHDPRCKLSPATVRENNAWVPGSVCQWALRNDTRFIAISSYSIFAGAGSGAYCESKRELEEQMYDLNLYRGASILRLGTLFGAEEGTPIRSFRPHLLLNSFMLDALAHGEVRVDKDARTRPVCPLGRAVSALVSLIEDPVPGHVRSVHMCSAYLKEFAELVADMVPGAKVVERETPAQDARNYAFPPTLDDPDMRDTMRFELVPLGDFIAANLRAVLRHRETCWAEYYKRAAHLRPYG